MLPAVLRDALEAARARAARRAAARQRRQKGRAGGGGRGGADAGDPEAGEDEDDEDLEFEHSDLVRDPTEGIASRRLEGGMRCQERAWKELRAGPVLLCTHALS